MGCTESKPQVAEKSCADSSATVELAAQQLNAPVAGAMTRDHIAVPVSGEFASVSNSSRDTFTAKEADKENNRQNVNGNSDEVASNSHEIFHSSSVITKATFINRATNDASNDAIAAELNSYYQMQYISLPKKNSIAVLPFLQFLATKPVTALLGNKATDEMSLYDIHHEYVCEEEFITKEKFVELMEMIETIHRQNFGKFSVTMEDIEKATDIVGYGSDEQDEVEIPPTYVTSDESTPPASPIASEKQHSIGQSLSDAVIAKPPVNGKVPRKRLVPKFEAVDGNFDIADIEYISSPRSESSQLDTVSNNGSIIEPVGSNVYPPRVIIDLSGAKLQATPKVLPRPVVNFVDSPLSPSQKKGFMAKQNLDGRLSRSRSARQFFVLDNGTLSYIDSKSKTPPFSIDNRNLFLGGTTARALDDATIELVRGPDVNGEIIYLAVKDSTERDVWLQALNEHIKFCNEAGMACPTVTHHAALMCSELDTTPMM